MSKDNRSKNGGEDKYYTRQYIADYVSQIIKDRYGNSEYIEPSAGSGIFLNSFKGYNISGYDINPHRDDIKKQDWFLINRERINGKVVVGNPPFGFSASLAIKFIEVATKGRAKAICFILPKTFKKSSLQNKIDERYHLVQEVELPKNSFFFYEKDNEYYDVPTVFQIWERSSKKRELEVLKTTSPYFEFTTKDKCDFCVRRAGGKSGQILEGIDHTESSTYFIKAKNDYVKKAFQIYDYKKYTDNTAGVKSISKHEIIEEIDRIVSILL